VKSVESRVSSRPLLLWLAACRGVAKFFIGTGSLFAILPGKEDSRANRGDRPACWGKCMNGRSGIGKVEKLCDSIAQGCLSSVRAVILVWFSWSRFSRGEGAWQNWATHFELHLRI
jgi:hypothetical protein